MLFGAHVSIAGGLPNAPLNASTIGCEVFQFFTRSPQGGYIAQLNKEIITEFLKNCKTTKQKEWYIHTPYFINFASGQGRIRHVSISVIKEELRRASELKAKYLMTHLGSYKDLGHDVGLLAVVDGLDEVLKDYKGSTKFLIEISAGAGEIIGDTFEEIAEIIDHKKLKKYNIGVCYDTQHGFASGYDIRNTDTVAETFTKFDKIIGLERLKLSHCNDSLTEFNSKKDRHANIGEGLIGKKGFMALINQPKLKNINLVLETPTIGVENDLDILKKMRKNI
jgi:deoxyribonuclease-4